MTSSSMPSKLDLTETLSWLAEMGVDEVLSERPVGFQSERNQPLQVQNKGSGPPTPKSQIPALEKDIMKAESLLALREILQNFEACDLKKTAKSLVFGDGDPKAKIMLIGEAPGADEDRQGKPFVGLSGQLLTKAFGTIGYERENLYITNILPWRPPGNRQPTTQEVSLCLPFVKRQIELVHPRLLIFVGGTSMKALLDVREGITKLRGNWFAYQSENLTQPICATAVYHPAYLLRSPTKKRDLWVDLLKIRQKVSEL